MFSRFGVALIIGILIGLQREYSHGGPDKELFAGVRTFALMSLIGCAVVDSLRIPPEPLYAIGLWYDDFAPTTDTEVCALLERRARSLRATGQRQQWRRHAPRRRSHRAPLA